MTGALATLKAVKGGNRTGDKAAETGSRLRATWAKRDLGSRSMTAREVSEMTSGVGWRVGATSMWTNAPRPGELGGRSG